MDSDCLALGPFGACKIAKKMNYEELKSRYGFRVPQRDLDNDGDDVKWRYGKKPDYKLADARYFRGKTQSHPPGTLVFLTLKVAGICSTAAEHMPQVVGSIPTGYWVFFFSFYSSVVCLYQLPQGGLHCWFSFKNVA